MTVGMAKDRLPLLRCHPGSSAQPALAIPGPSPAPGTQPFLCSGWVTQSLIGGPGRSTPTLAPKLSRGSVLAGVGKGIFIPSFSEVS